MAGIITAKEGGEVRLGGILISNYKDVVIDITDSFSELNIFEDMLSHCLSGSVTVVDSINLANFLPIVGEEKLKIAFNTPGLENPEDKFEHDFYVYKISSSVSTNTNTKVYVIDFISFEGVVDVNLKISKKFSGKPEESIKSILRNQSFLGSKKRFEFNESINDVDFVSPYWSPFKTINWLSTRAVPVVNPAVSDFVFYENRNGFNLRSLEALILSKPVASYFYHDDKNKLSTDSSSPYTKIIRYTTDDTSDYIQNIQDSMFGHTLFIHDIIAKKFAVKKTTYSKIFEKTEHLNEFPLYSHKLINLSNSSQTYFSRDHYSSGEFQRDFADRVQLNRTNRLKQIGANRLNIEIYGRTDITIGNKIELFFPKNTSNGKSNQDRFDGILSGFYLITAINHRVTLDNHTMVVEVVKDSYKEEVFKK